MTIGVIDVGISNIGSLSAALYVQGWNVRRVSAPDDFLGITHLLLPGVGSYATAMERLRKAGLIEPIRSHAAAGRPLLGICLGMQLMADIGFEGGLSTGLELIPGEVQPFDMSLNLRLPHVGWNACHQLIPHKLLTGIKADIDFYFVHSYFFHALNRENVVGITQYGITFPSFIACQNIVGVQFHPEKSQRNGLQLLNNFCLWNGRC